MTLETFRFDLRIYGHCKFGVNAGLIYTKRLLIVTPEGFFCENFQGLIGQKYQTFTAQQWANRVPGYCSFFQYLKHLSILYEPQ